VLIAALLLPLSFSKFALKPSARPIHNFRRSFPIPTTGRPDWATGQ
jgi:hypothetical protein